MRIRGGRVSDALRDALKTGNIRNLSWPELQAYAEWVGCEKKDLKITFRISATDAMKLKALARMKGSKYQTYMRDIVKREILLEEDRLATATPRTPSALAALGSGTSDA